MTQSGQTPESDDALVPPASTHWSGGEDREGDGAEDGLIAPFVPGQSRRTERPGGPGAERGEVAGPRDPGTGAATGGEAVERFEPEPVDAPDDAFPFDMPWSDAAEPASGTGGGGAGGAFGGAVEADELDEDDFPTEDDFADADDFATEEDDFPIEAFDFGPEPSAGAPTGGAGAGLGAEVTGAAGRSAAEEVAERLEHLASRLRAEGAEGVERELAASDRLTSLLAALLAGHLASR